MCLLAMLFSLVPLSPVAYGGEMGLGAPRSLQESPVISEAQGKKGSTYVIELETEPLPYSVVFKTTSKMPPGHLRKVQHGVPGVVYRAVQKTMKEGRVVARTLLWETQYPPVPAIILVGEPKRFLARGSYRRTRHLDAEATAYCPGGCCGTGSGRTAMGIRAGFGVAAVDPAVIPLGSVMYVEGYGFAIAADVGRSIRGNRIDLGFGTHAEARRFGRKSVKVHILQEE
jgi:3D (Asp-Asp-Asp) domain-containing protein